jgi:hypothetical protein
VPDNFYISCKHQDIPRSKGTLKKHSREECGLRTHCTQQKPTSLHSQTHHFASIQLKNQGTLSNQTSPMKINFTLQTEIRYTPHPRLFEFQGRKQCPGYSRDESVPSPNPELRSVVGRPLVTGPCTRAAKWAELAPWRLKGESGTGSPIQFGITRWGPPNDR